jgi:hypothetical protein
MNIREDLDGIVDLVNRERSQSGLETMPPEQEAQLRRCFLHYFRRSYVIAKIVEALKVTYAEASVIAKKLAKNGIDLRPANL